MAWTAPSRDQVARFRRLTAELDGVEPRTMFGCPCAFVNGRMFAGVFQDRWFLRLPESERGSMPPFEPVRGRRMKEYVEVSAAHPRLSELVRSAHRYAQSLAPKKKKSRSRRPGAS
jgi:TfoX/Sxy family transcriptional regulator of competence genes